MLVTTEGPSDDPAGLAAALDRCERIVSVPYVVQKRNSAGFALTLARSWLSHYPVDLWKWRTAGVRRLIAQLIAAGRFDIVVADFLFAVPNVPMNGGTPVVFFAHNVEHLIWKRLTEVEGVQWRRPLLELEWRKLRRAEAEACAQAQMTIAVSDQDRDLFRQHAPAARVVTIPTGVDTQYFVPDPDRERPNRLVFTGSMDWYPNEDAMLHFIDAILPRIRQSRPDVEVVVVGRNPTSRLRARAAAAAVALTGTVEDVRPHVAEAALSIVPLRVGGGTRLKIFESLAMGKPVVSTSVGAEGLGLESGRHVLIADTPEDFSRRVVSLLNTPDRRRTLAREGRRLVEQRYGWPMVAHAFESHLLEVVDGGQTAGAPRRAAVS